MKKDKAQGNMQTSRGRRRLSWFLCLAFLLLAATPLVYGAYMGVGSRKGVLTGTISYFTSDVLTRISAATQEDVQTSRHITESCSFVIRNHDIASLERDNYAVNYTLYVWVDKAGETDCSYKLTYGGTEEDLEGYTENNPFALNGSFAAGELEIDTYAVAFEAPPNTYSKATIYVVAQPTSPAFMTNKLIGAKFQHASDAFAASGAFLYAAGAATDDYAGFTYRVTMTGTPEAAQTVQITWDPALALDQHSAYYTSGVSSITVDPAEVWVVTLVFYRDIAAQQAAPGEGLYWAQPRDWAAVNALVTVSVSND